MGGGQPPPTEIERINMVQEDFYVGRLACDGYGNLLADEGDRAGDPVAYHEGSFVFVQPGEPSHNERHHEQHVSIVGTQHTDPDSPGYAGAREAAVEGSEHHFGVLEDDPHFKGLRADPDKFAVFMSSHTEQHKVGA